MVAQDLCLLNNVTHEDATNCEIIRKVRRGREEGEGDDGEREGKREQRRKEKRA